MPIDTSLTVGNKVVSDSLDLPVILEYKRIQERVQNFVIQQNACAPFQKTSETDGQCDSTKPYLIKTI
jgi:hypothetical protein